MESARDKRPPQWLILLVVIATAGVTVWAIWQTGLAGPKTSWNTAQQAVQQIWAGQANAVAPGAPMQAGVAQNMAGAVAAPPPAQSPPAAPPPLPAQTSPLPGDPATRTVAGLPGVPVIMWGANRPHPDRGACTNCHSVVRGNGAMVPTIFSFSVMPHGYRGVCINCHQVTTAGVNPVAGVMGQPPGFAAQQAAPRPPPNEAEWRGLEVRAASQGVVVTKADGTAARMGMQPGDVVQSINGITVNDMNNFVQATQNGNLPQGTLIARRNNQRLAFELGAAGNNGAMAAPPMGGANGVNAF